MITLAELKEALGITGNQDDVKLQRLIDRATDTLGRALNRYLGPPVEVVEIKAGGRYPGAGLGTLVLDEDPVESEAVVVETRGWGTLDWDVLLALEAGTTNYVLEGRALIHRSYWPAGPGTVRVTYTAGYAPGTGPQHLQDVVLSMATSKWTEDAAAVATDPALKSETIGDYSYTLADVQAAAGALEGGWQELVDRWRRRNL